MVRGLALPAFVLCLMIPAAIVATAAPSPTPFTAPRTLSVFPKEEGTTTLPGHFRYDLVPGASAQDGEVVQNFTDNPLTVDFYAADLVEATGGGVAPTPKGSLLHGVGAWITVAEPTITVPAHTQTTVNFTVTVPVGVTPANNEGAVVAEALVGGAGQVGVAARVALIVEVDVPGTAHPSGTLGALTEIPGDAEGSKRFKLDLTNTGNVLLIQGGAVVVRDTNGDEVTRLPLTPTDGYAIPGGTLHLVSTSWNPPGIGRFSVQAEVPIAYNTVNGPKASGTLLSNALAYSFLDWRIVAGAAIVLLVILYALWRLLATWLHRRRRSPEQRAEAERLRQLQKEAKERLKKL